MATNIPQMPAYDTMAHFDRVAAQIEQTFQQLIDQLIARKDCLLDKVLQLREDFHNKEATRVAALEELEKAQLQIQQISLKVNVNLPVHEQTGLLYQQAKQQLSAPTILPNLSFCCPALSLLQSQISQFGEVAESRAPDYSKKQQSILTAGKKGKGEDELSGIGLTLDEKHQKVYIADCNNSRVQVLSFQGEFLSKFGKEVLKRPWGIAITENHIFVTDNALHKLLQFSRHSHELINTAGVKGANERQLSYPQGLSVDKNGEVFIADTYNDRVSVFSKELQFQSCLGKGFLNFPQDVQLTPDKVLVLDWSLQCVHFFSRSGDLLTSCVTHGGGKECLVYRPSFFCIDAEQNLIISDYSHHNVKIVSNSGELLHTIGKEGNEKGEFKYPNGIAISNSGILFVLSFNPNYCLQCF